MKPFIWAAETIGLATRPTQAVKSVLSPMLNADSTTDCVLPGGVTLNV